MSGGPIQDVDDHEIKYLKRGQFIIPGFIDGHVHAVQYPNLGLGYDRTLLKWLDTYTAPLEMRFHDDGFASKVFDLAVVIKFENLENNVEHEICRAVKIIFLLCSFYHKSNL